MYRTKAVREREMKIKKVNRENWYRKGKVKYTSTFVLPATKDSRLTGVVEESMKTIPNPDGLKIKNEVILEIKRLEDFNFGKKLSHRKKNNYV